MRIRRKIIGLSVSLGSVSVVEIETSRAGPKALGAADFSFPEGLGLDNPSGLGKALRDFLRDKGMSARLCVIGIETRWMTARTHALPPGGNGLTASILRLAVEQEFATDAQNIMADYAGPVGSDPQRRVTLFVADRSHVESVLEMCAAAGLSPLAVTSSVIALAQASVQSDPPHSIVLRPSSGGMEVGVLPRNASPMVARIPGLGALDGEEVSQPQILNRLEAELGRIMLQMPDSGDAAQQAELIIPGGVGMSQATSQDLAARMSMSFRSADWPMGLAGSETTGDDGTVRYATAAALAMMALPGRRPAFDLINSRLSQPRKRILGRKTRWAAACVLTALVCAGALLAEWQGNIRDVQEMRERLDSMSDGINQAKDIVDKTSLARQWYLQDPRCLKCMKEIVQTFPQEGRIWTTSLAIENGRRVVFSGKAVSEVAVLDVLDRLKGNPMFSDVKPLYLRDSGRNGREIAFAMSCSFAGGN